jgi:hypothetical protein
MERSPRQSKTSHPRMPQLFPTRRVRVHLKGIGSNCIPASRIRLFGQAPCGRGSGRRAAEPRIHRPASPLAPGNHEAVCPSVPTPRRQRRLAIAKLATRALAEASSWSSCNREAARRKACGFHEIAQKRFSHKASVGSSAVIGNAPLVGKSNCDPSPIELYLRKPVEEPRGRFAAGDDEPRDASRRDRRAQALRRSVSEILRQPSAIGELAAMQIRLNHSYSSFQVRPSRSIKATDALGPHVPAAYGRGNS